MEVVPSSHCARFSWVVSSAKKEDADEDIAKYDGGFTPSGAPDSLLKSHESTYKMKNKMTFPLIFTVLLIYTLIINAEMTRF